MPTEAIKVDVSKAGLKKLSLMNVHLDIQIELLFSCLLRKRVLFHNSADVVSYPMTSDIEKLNIHFRPVMTKVCMMSDTDEAPDLEDFPIHKAEAFKPRWLKLDYDEKNDRWTGEYGWL